jgi:hypothetical protein
VNRPISRALLTLFDDAGFTPRSLFASGEQGIWLDPSDFSTLFQDAAGTTPVTALGQPVGKILDKSGRGNHASQATAASRPTVEARVNLLTKTSAPAEWTYTNSPTVVLDVPDPFGTALAATITDADTLTSRYITLPIVTLGGESISRQLSVYVKKQADNAPALIRAMHSGGTTVDARACINTTTGEVAAVASCTATAVAHIAADGGEWWKVTLTAGSSGNTSVAVYLYAGAVLGSTSIAAVHVGTNTYAFPQLALSSDPMRDTYQRVNTATDYVDIGAPRYLQFDGTDDGMATASINFTGTDKMTVWAGVRKNSDAATGTVVELSAAIGSNSGAFSFFAPISAATNAQYGSKGTTASFATPGGLTSPLTFVMCGQSDIAAPSVSARINGVVAASSTSSQGTGNYGNYPLYIGRRGGTTLPFNGRIYQLIVRGAESNAGQIAAGEAWC